MLNGLQASWVEGVYESTMKKLFRDYFKDFAARRRCVTKATHRKDWRLSCRKQTKNYSVAGLKKSGTRDAPTRSRRCSTKTVSLTDYRMILRIRSEEHTSELQSHS